MKRGAAGPSPSADVLALSALGWVLQDQDRADRLLSLTGLTPERLRAAVSEKSVQAAVLDYLQNYEPDLIRAAEALDVPPEELVAAHAELSR